MIEIIIIRHTQNILQQHGIIIISSVVQKTSARPTSQPASGLFSFYFPRPTTQKLASLFRVSRAAAATKKKCRKENMFLRAIKRTRYIKEKPHHYRHVAEEMPCGKFASQQPDTATAAGHDTAPSQLAMVRRPKKAAAPGMKFKLP